MIYDFKFIKTIIAIQLLIYIYVETLLINILLTYRQLQFLLDCLLFVSFKIKFKPD